MGFNYASEKKKFTKKWDKLRKEYKAAGMSEQDIQVMYEFDLKVFRNNRNECNHTQPLLGNLYEDQFEQDETTSVLLKNFLNETSKSDKHCFQDNPRFAWIDELENYDLYTKICFLPKKDIDLITLIAFEGYTQKEVAVMRGNTATAICNKIKKIKKYLSGG